MINEPNSAEPRLRVRVTPFVHAAIVLCIVISAHDFPLVLLLLRLPMPSTTVSKARILGNAELFIKSGNDINLTCTTSQDSSPPSFIYWYKGGRVVNYSQRGGINVSTDRTTKTSNLIISRASPADSGNYTCAPSNSGKLIIEIAQFGLACSDSDLLLTLSLVPSDADFVMVHVISNIDAAAMKHGNNSGTSLGCASFRCHYSYSTSPSVWKCLIILMLINKSFSIR
jgi:Immunoglobulin domain